MPPPELKDGQLPTGCFDITVLETGQTYVADNFQGDQEVTVVRRKNSIGLAAAQKFIKAFLDGSADLQLASESTPIPEPGMAFLADFDGDGTAEPWLVQKPGKTFSMDGETKLKCAISAAVNPVIYGSAGKTTVELYNGITYASGGAITALNLEAYLPAGATLLASSWAATGLPTGLTISASTGDITGTPSAPGTSYVRVTVQATRTFVRNRALYTQTLTGVREFIVTIT